MINLLPTDMVEEIKYGRRNWWLMKHILVICSCGLVIAGLGVMSGWLMQQNKEPIVNDIAAATKSVDNLKEPFEEAAAVSATLNSADKLLSKRTSMAVLLERIAAVMPAGSSIDAITLNSQASGTIDFLVEAKSNETASALEANLTAQNDINPFSKAELTSLTCQTGSAAASTQYPCRIGVKATFKSDIFPNRSASQQSASTSGSSNEE